MKNIIDEENYDREVMKYQTNEPKEKLLILQHYPFKVRELKQWHCGCV